MVGSFSGVFAVMGLTSNGELKLKLGGLELIAAAASFGLTVTNGAENVKAGRGAGVLVVKVELNNPFDEVVTANDVFTVDATTGAETEGGGGSKPNVGKDPIGIRTAVRSEVMGSSSSSSRMRAASLADSRRGAAFRVRILPPDWALIGVLATGAVSTCVFTVGGSGRLTTCAGVLTESLVAGGPKFGRRLLKPNPVN